MSHWDYAKIVNNRTVQETLLYFPLLPFCHTWHLRHWCLFFLLWPEIYSLYMNSLSPGWATHHLEKSQIPLQAIVEVYVWVPPPVSQRRLIQTFLLVVNFTGWQPVSFQVLTFVELATKKLNTGNTEDEPEDKTNQQHVEDGRDGVHQGIHHNLKSWRMRKCSGHGRMDTAHAERLNK